MKNNVRSKPPKKKSYLKDDIQLLFMISPALILLAIFSYWPMYGLILSFKNYKVTDGIWGSKWVGLKNFEFFFKSNDLFRVLRNTLGLNFMFIFVGLAASVGFALLMFEVKKARHVKIYQTVSILPNFISWVAVSFMVYGLLEFNRGMINHIIRNFGGEGIKFYEEAGWWPMILLVVNLWHSVGMGSIIYYAGLLSSDQELYEAADIDGATKVQKIWYVSIPQLIPIMTIRTIMSVGSIFRSDFGMFYNVPRNIGALYKTTDVIDTYVYRALMELGNIGMSSAVGMFQSVVCFVTLLIANNLAGKISPENTLF